ncbi:hypothetical protein CGRA01v4_10728 [Colletotrichum graminicola]|uniref:Uncharacterized protein n=1 Tax=Colletotrichum graminicola (strain M1.001 / M2 / FGSC 10212) TaxID=645133 RepID=E3QSK1_COLGM|nr:uncharacterized protein GLRG_08983 [Colletotrichum graminicola M1.001]EFQ33839.1 hypothetical protein GLRG_08983 [Colletotrichum graminicola M1.001]WDK19441.1 hypothetical protein CGRA01v4_10728 [Colletotrichum graminicola]
MSSNQNHPGYQYTSVPRPRQGQTPQTPAYQQAGASSTLNSWLSEDASKAPFHAIGSFRSVGATSGNGAGMWSSSPAPSSTGATWGSGPSRQS